MYYRHYAMPTGKKGVRSPRSGVINKCKPPYGYWGPNLDPLQEQRLTQLSLQPPN